MSRALGMALSSSQPVSCDAAPGLSAPKPVCCQQGAQIPQAALSPAISSSTRAHRRPLFRHLWTVSPPRSGLATWLLAAPKAGQYTISPGTTSRRLLIFLVCMDKDYCWNAKKKNQTKKKVDFSQSFTPEGLLRDQAYPKQKENIFVSGLYVM